MEEVGLNIFSDISSYVFDETGLMIYSSWFSDENKYFGYGTVENLDCSIESLKEYFKKTTPEYEKGFIVRSAESAYQPFISTWQRYGKSHVYKAYNRNPMKGENGEVGITFDDDDKMDQKLLSESNGTIYRKGCEMNLTDEMEIANRIEEIYQSCYSETGFDIDSFNEEFEKTMFESNSRRIM